MGWAVRGGFFEEVAYTLKHEGSIHMFKEQGRRGAVRDRAAGAKQRAKGTMDPRKVKEMRLAGTK